MERIYDGKDLRRAYINLNMIREFGSKKAMESDFAIGIKRGIREYNARKNLSRIIKDNGIDSYVALIRMDDELDGLDAESADQWFRSNRYIESVPSMYDCTGRPFTMWYKMVRRRGHWFAYHCVGFDV